MVDGSGAGLDEMCVVCLKHSDPSESDLVHVRAMAVDTFGALEFEGQDAYTAEPGPAAVPDQPSAEALRRAAIVQEAPPREIIDDKSQVAHTVPLLSSG